MLSHLSKKAGRQRFVTVRTQYRIIAHPGYIWGIPALFRLRLGLLLVWLCGKEVVAQLAQLPANALELRRDGYAGKLEGGGCGGIIWGLWAGVGVIDRGGVDGVHPVSGDLEGGGRRVQSTKESFHAVSYAPSVNNINNSNDVTSRLSAPLCPLAYFQPLPCLHGKVMERHKAAEEEALRDD